MDPAQKQRIAKMFSAAAKRSTAVRNDAATSQTGDAMLVDILGDLGGPAAPTPKARTPVARSACSCSSQAVCWAVCSSWPGAEHWPLLAVREAQQCAACRPAPEPKPAARIAAKHATPVPRPRVKGPSRLAPSGPQQQAHKRQRTSLDVEDALASLPVHEESETSAFIFCLLCAVQGRRSLSEQHL